MYAKKPTILQNVQSETPVVTIEEHVKDKSRRNIRYALRSNQRIADYAYFYRDKDRWLRPAKVVKIDGPILHQVHTE